MKFNIVIGLILGATFLPSVMQADEKSNKDAKFWAKEVQKGGYILHFRHGHRNRYTITPRTPETDVTAFDAVSMIKGLKGENEDFGLVTCLTQEGVAEAKLVRDVFQILKVKVSDVMSSPSCRARQTSYHAFGTEGRIVNSLLHRTSIPTHQWKEASINLRKKILETDMVKGQNLILSGHVGTLNFNDEDLFDKNEVGNMSDRDDIGFVIIERIGKNKLVARYMFQRFRDFSVEIMEVPFN